MRTCVVTVAGPDKRVDLTVPAETPIKELLPTFVELSVAEPADEDGREPAWGVALPGRNPFPAGATLSECGVVDGTVLVLTELRSRQEAPPSPKTAPPPEPRRGSPLERSRIALPEPMSFGSRLHAAISAFFGRDEEPVEDTPEPRDRGNSPSALTLPRKTTATERWRASWDATDYLQNLDRRIAGPRLRRCVTIAVVSPKGGVGKTTITALLGSLLAHVRRDRIVAVDCNPDYGSLGRALAPEHTTFVDDLLDILDHPTLTVTELDGHLGRTPDGLMVLPAPTDPERMARLNEDAYLRVIRRLQDLVGVLILDCGTGLHEPAARAALATADQVLLVSDAQPATASLVAEASTTLRHAGGPITLVVNKLPTSKREARLDLEHLGRLVPEAMGLLTVGNDPTAAAHVAAGELSWRQAPAAWERSIRELAAVLTADWPRLGLGE